MENIAQRVRELLDRQAIADCVQRYARGIDRNDVDLVASCYHSDAIDDHGPYVGSGRGLAEWVSAELASYLHFQHHITNHVVELDGDSAHAETYYLGVARATAGIVSIASGRYIDRFERRDGEWRIAARVCMVDSIAEGQSADYMEQIERAFAPGSRDRSDLSYQRPLTGVRRSPQDEHPSRRS
jgi:ketosteroid isomerase-like protein